MTADEPVIMGYQDHFRSSVRFTMEAVLAQIGIPVRLSRVVFVAVPGPEMDGEKYLLPALDHPVDLDLVRPLADELYEQHPLRHMVHTHAAHHDARQAGIRRRCLADAVARVLTDSGAFDGRAVTFTAVARNDYEIVTCLDIPARVFEDVPALEPHEWGTLRSTTSLLDAALAVVEGAVVHDLGYPDPGPADVTLRPAELLARAADDFFRDALYRGGTFLDLPRSTVDTIATATYEKAAAAGYLLIAHAESTAVDLEARFEAPIAVGKVRQVRKLLETSSARHGLVVADGRVVGTGSYEQERIEASDRDVLEVVVTGHSMWELRHHGDPLMIVEHGSARLLRPSFDVARLLDMCPRLFGEGAQANEIHRLVQAASLLGHGSTLVVSADAVAEAQRLGDQGVRVVPEPLTDARLSALSRVDGAFLLDPSGVLHAFGVILDGSADGADGDPARGSRYNSAVRYASSRPDREVLAVVTSDDGGVDLVPDLPPRVPRQLVADAVDQLGAAFESQRPEAFAEAERRLRSLSFYLSEAQAQEANSVLKLEAESRLSRGMIAVDWPVFELSAAPDDEFFL